MSLSLYLCPNSGKKNILRHPSQMGLRFPCGNTHQAENTTELIPTWNTISDSAIFDHTIL